MSDRLERDVEEVLSNIEDFDWRRRRQREPGPLRRAVRRVGDFFLARIAGFNAGHLMLFGALLLVLGFILRLRSVGVWAVVAGVVLLIIGLVWTARGGGRSGGSRGGGRPSTRGGYWRDRYIAYDEPRRPSPSQWLRRLRRPR